MRNVLKTLALVTAVAGTTSLPVVAEVHHSSDALEMRMSDQDVWGVRELESGNIDTGIERLERRLELYSANRRRKAPILIDLCVAYTLKRSFENAANYCNAAVENGRDRGLAYNNRGVFHYLNGDVHASNEDLERATLLHFLIAKRNLARVTLRSGV